MDLTFGRTLVILMVFFGNFISAQDLPDSTEYQYGRAIKCKSDEGVLQRCMPVFENIAFNKDITANNTCGLTEPSKYCVQTGTSGAKKICDVCDNRYQGQRHPANLMTDIKLDDQPTWWQSETLLENKYGVHLILDFKKKYNVAFVRIRFHTIRPHSFAIYKKTTYDPNARWIPYQFYSRTCNETYGVPNRQTLTLANQKIALCTDKASGMIPLSGGNVAYLTLDHRPGKKEFDKYPALQDWVTVTALKFSLDRVNTFGDEVFGDPKVLKSYYFAISDIAVGGRCKCNGHASACSKTDTSYHCKCDHNTAGKDCEKCLPLYNDQPWSTALGRDPKPCKKCDCNGLADECVFDEQLYIDSNKVSGGRCINCQENTDGVHCERCKDYHYRENKRAACKPCSCDKDGSQSLSCNSQGQCACKPGVDGDKCNRCREGYYGFSAAGCKACRCNPEGSKGINCNAIGQCECKENVVGLICDQCKAQHFDLDETNPKGCKQCFCYGHGVSCTALEGIGSRYIRSSFESDFEGWTVEDEFGNDHSASALFYDKDSHYVYVKPRRFRELYLVAPRSYLGNRLSSYAKTFKFRYGTYLRQENEVPQTSRNDIIFEGAGLTATYELTDQGNILPEGRFVPYNYKLIEPEGMTTFNFQRLLSDLTAIKIRMTYFPGSLRRKVLDDVALESTTYISRNSPEQVSWSEKCECERGYTGDQCEKCDFGYTRAAGESGHYRRCVPCECNNHGSQCDPETGVCVCKDNTTGRNCEECLEGFYGNPTRGKPDDCKPCPCIFANKCILIGSRITCTDCPKGHTGDRCEKCEDGYFGDPTGKLGNATRCQKCDCNGNVNPEAKGNCDRLTGACLQCIHNTTNGPLQSCEECAKGFYGDALAKPIANCSACNCFENGTLTPPGHSSGDPIPCDKNGKCQCRDNVIGQRCNKCPAGHWNVASGKGCEKCNCNPDGSIGDDCDVNTGQCKCKPGVAGRTCNQCATGHYKFSPTGCRPCNCHPDGSKHQNCTSKGICECLPGVLGIKCDQCPENKYNLSVGCIACPKCFDLIQVAVNELREKLLTFNFTQGNFTDKNPGIDVRDKNFEAAIKALDKEIQELRKKTEGLLKGDQELYSFFQSLSQQFNRLFKRFDDLKNIVEKSKGASKTGQAEIQKAEEVIDLIKSLLKDAEDRLKREGFEIYKNAISSADDLSDAAKRMREIAEEARKLAEKHEKDAADIKMTTDMAYNTSVDAHKTAREARTKEETINKDLKDMVKDGDEASLLAKESRILIKQAENTSTTALKEAEDLIEEARKPLPDFGINATKAKADNITNSAQNIHTSSEKLITDNEPVVVQLKKDDIEGRKLIAEGRELQEKANNMYIIAKNASDNAKAAQEDGSKVATEAKEMLETLQGFNDIIKRSKKNATKALELVDLIKKLIKEANDTALTASANAGMAEGDANMSLDIAQKANATTHAAKKEIDDIMQEALKLLNETMSFIMNELQDTKNAVNTTDVALDGYKMQAEIDAKSVDSAYNESVLAGNAAAKAKNDLQKSLQDVEELMVGIDGLDQIDYATLEDAEKRFQIAKDIIEENITAEIEILERKVLEQENTIKQYELDLTPLENQIAEREKITSALPTYQCFRQKTRLEKTDE